MIFGECQVFLDAVNEACSCGGSPPDSCCAACAVYHSVSGIEIEGVAHKDNAAAEQRGLQAGRVQAFEERRDEYTRRSAGLRMLRSERHLGIAEGLRRAAEMASEAAKFQRDEAAKAGGSEGKP